MFERIFREDTVKIDHRNYVEDTDPVFGPITVFKDVVIASEIIHPYEDGNAYKPADELELAYWTWDNRWAISNDHPATGIISKRGDVHGRTVNLRFVKNLKDHKTDRPNRRGVLADLQVFNKKVSPETLQDMKNGTLSDVSIGFFFSMDATPGTIDEEGHPLNGQEYDYIQRNFMGDHTAFGIVKGRCTMPYCGLGADKMMQQITGDPLGKYKDFADCVAKNKDKDDPKAYCGSIEAKIKAAKKKKDITDVPDNIPMSDALEDLKNDLQIILDKIPSIVPPPEDEKEGVPPLEEDVVGDCPDCEDDEEEVDRIATDLSLEEIDKKLKELKAARESLREKVRALDEKLYSEPDAEKKRKAKLRDERGELWDRLDDLYDEIRAYTQAKTLKITRAALADAEKPEDDETANVPEAVVPFDVEASQRVTERAKAVQKEQGIR